MVPDRHSSPLKVVMRGPEAMLPDRLVSIQEPHLQHAAPIKVLTNVYVQQPTSYPVHLQVKCPARNIVRIPRLSWVVRAPPSVVTDDNKISIGQARGERVMLAGPVLLLRLLARERDHHHHAALAPEHVVREANLAHLVWRRLHQARRARYPRFREEWRVGASPGPFRLRAGRRIAAHVPLAAAPLETAPVPKRPRASGLRQPASPWHGIRRTTIRRRRRAAPFAYWRGNAHAHGSRARFARAPFRSARPPAP